MGQSFRVLLRETVIDEEDGDWQVPSLIVGWQNDRVSIFGIHY